MTDQEPKKPSEGMTDKVRQIETVVMHVEPKPAQEGEKKDE